MYRYDAAARKERKRRDFLSQLLNRVEAANANSASASASAAGSSSPANAPAGGTGGQASASGAPRHRRLTHQHHQGGVPPAHP